MTGNSECNIYKAIGNNDFSITECFSEQTQLRSNMNELWKILNKLMNKEERTLKIFTKGRRDILK